MKNSSMKSNRKSEINSNINESEIVKYEEFLKSCNEKNRILQKTDLIVLKIYLKYFK